jgi:osmoprotectant transport system permease protein
VLAAYDGHAWVDWSWVGDHGDEILARLREHAVLLGWSLLLGLLFAIPLALISLGHRRTYASVLAITGILYTIPSLAAFSLLLPYTATSRLTAIIPLAGYCLLILVRNIVTGLEQVPADIQDAAIGIGLSPRRKLWQVDVPLALPTIMAGIRIATVTLIGLIPVSALVGQGGLGQLMTDGFDRDFYTPIVVGVALTIVLAVGADALLLGIQRLLMPWSRRAVVR